MIGAQVIETDADTNSIGEPLMPKHWQDPDYDSGQRAFYYVRVLEIPTPR